MLIEALRTRTPICELPIKTVYIDGNLETHFRPVLDSIAIYKVILVNFFKYTLSSLSSFLLDYGLFCLLDIVCGHLSMTLRVWISSVGARLGSSFYNYFVNKKLVFKSEARGTLTKYYALCIVQLLCSAFLVWLVSGGLSISEMFVKPVVDALLFLISYRVQQRWVFGEVRS